MVALPDFAMGAMENWGLITYRETALLYDPDNYYLDNKQRVATVIAHELAHMWFGNLVTMKWQEQTQLFEIILIGGTIFGLMRDLPPWWRILA